MPTATLPSPRCLLCVFAPRAMFILQSAMALAVAACAHPSPVASPAASPTASRPEPSPPPPPDEPAPKPLLSIDWKAVHLATDEDAVALWRQIAPTGADWELRIGELPDEDELLRRLAFAVLRGGNFACKPRLAEPSEPISCTSMWTLSAAEDSTFDDPCLRRELALWALDRLDDEDVPSLQRELLAIASLPPPEEELLREAFQIVPAGRDDLLLPMLEAAVAAGQGAIADEFFTELAPAQLESSALKLHSNSAILSLDPSQSRPAFLAAIADRKLLPATRITAIDDLFSEGDGRLKKDLRAVLLTALKDPSCEVAAAAARTLVVAGERRFAPKPQAATIPAALRNLCVSTAYSQDAPIDSSLSRLVSKRGLQIYDHSAITAEPGQPTEEVILPAELVALPFLDELAPALERCSPTPASAGRPASPLAFTCQGEGLRFELTFEPDRTLRRIERFASPSTCSP